MKTIIVKMPYDAALQRIDEIQAAINRADNMDVESAVALGMARDALAREQATVNPQPLTLDELRGIETPTPIWVSDLWGVAQAHWELVEWVMIRACPLEKKLHVASIDGKRDDYYIDLDNYGKTWLAYRTKPEVGGSIQ